MKGIPNVVNSCYLGSLLQALVPLFKPTDDQVGLSAEIASSFDGDRTGPDEYKKVYMVYDMMVVLSCASKNTDNYLLENGQTRSVSDSIERIVTGVDEEKRKMACPVEVLQKLSWMPAMEFLETHLHKPQPNGALGPWIHTTVDKKLEDAAVDKYAIVSGETMTRSLLGAAGFAIVSMVIFSDMANGPHYTTIRRAADDNVRWFEYDDSKVTELAGDDEVPQTCRLFVVRKANPCDVDHRGKPPTAQECKMREDEKCNYFCESLGTSFEPWRCHRKGIQRPDEGNTPFCNQHYRMKKKKVPEKRVCSHLYTVQGNVKRSGVNLTCPRNAYVPGNDKVCVPGNEQTVEDHEHCEIHRLAYGNCIAPRGENPNELCYRVGRYRHEFRTMLCIDHYNARCYGNCQHRQGDTNNVCSRPGTYSNWAAKFLCTYHTKEGEKAAEHCIYVKTDGSYCTEETADTGKTLCTSHADTLWGTKCAFNECSGETEYDTESWAVYCLKHRLRICEYDKCESANTYRSREMNGTPYCEEHFPYPGLCVFPQNDGTACNKPGSYAAGRGMVLCRRHNPRCTMPTDGIGKCGQEGEYSERYGTAMCKTHTYHVDDLCARASPSKSEHDGN